MRPLLPLVLIALGLAACFDEGQRSTGPSASGDAVRSVLSGDEGPEIMLHSSRGGVWRGDDPSPRPLFTTGKLDFRWFASPDPSGPPVTGYSYRVGDADWTPYSLDVTSWAGILGDLQPGVAAPFAVRAMDSRHAVTELQPTLLVFPGPKSHPESEQSILVVLDTDSDALESAGIWPADYKDIERSLVQYFFAGVDFEIFETHGFDAPSAVDLDHASSVFWFHSCDSFNLDASVLGTWHETGMGWHLLASYVKSGGNFFLCGIQPVNALRWIDHFGASEPEFVTQLPILFEDTLDDPEAVPHWVAADLKIAHVETTVPNLPESPVVALAASQVTAVSNPYPDLEFDPLSIPNGFDRGGFPYYDSGVQPRDGGEVLFRDSETGQSIGVRRLSQSGSNGSVVVLGFHPWFVRKSQFRSLITAVLEDFGTAGHPSGEELADARR